MEQIENARIVEVRQESSGYGMGGKRIESVLYYSETRGYFCITNVNCNAGVYCYSKNFGDSYPSNWYWDE